MIYLFTYLLFPFFALIYFGSPHPYVKNTLFNYNFYQCEEMLMDKGPKHADIFTVSFIWTQFSIVRPVNTEASKHYLCIRGTPCLFVSRKPECKVVV